jgi:hypothetical protein
MDPAIGRFLLDRHCISQLDGQGEYYNPASQFRRCRTDDHAFGKLIAQYGAALAPLASHPVRTTGFGGFHFAIQGAYTTIDNDAPYWRRGTQGAVDESRGLASIENPDPDGFLQNYQLYLAKGFPLGLQIAAGFGFLANTEIISGGADVRIALFEGFRESVPGFLPDVGVGGAVRTVTGTSEFKLTVASFDAELSKPIPIAATVTIQPHIGYQWMMIFGDSGLIDLTPNTDPVVHCGYQGDNTPATPDPGKDGFDGQPVCTGSSADFNNNVVFDKIRLVRHRLHGGLQFRYQMVVVGFHMLGDVIPPEDANEDGEFTMADAPTADDPTGRTCMGPNGDRGACGSVPQVNRLGDDPRTPEDDSVDPQLTFVWEIGAAF